MINLKYLYWKFQFNLDFRICQNIWNRWYVDGWADKLRPRAERLIWKNYFEMTRLAAAYIITTQSNAVLTSLFSDKPHQIQINFKSSTITLSRNFSNWIFWKRHPPRMPHRFGRNNLWWKRKWSISCHRLRDDPTWNQINQVTTSVLKKQRWTIWKED